MTREDETSATCGRPIDPAVLADYWLAVLPAADHLAIPDRAADVARFVDEFLLRAVNATRDSRR